MLSLNTNMTSLMIQKNLQKATAGISSALEQLTTGYRINHAKDDPANYAIMKNMEVKLNSWGIAEENINIGYNMLETAASSAELVSAHIMRIRDLCEQACNGTYGEQSIKAIQAEVQGRLDEISRIKASTEFNGIKLFEDNKSVNIQIGIDSSENSRLAVSTGLTLEGLSDIEINEVSNPQILDKLDGVLNELNRYQTKIGAYQNRLSYSLEYAELMTNNLTSSLSTIRDADIAKVSSDLIRFQILQQACITLLATANQQPALALQLL